MACVLIVDDQAGIRGMLKMLFQHLKYDVLVCDNAKEALTLMHDVDVMITDYLLPELTGNEIVQKVREESQLPIVVMSGLIDEVRAKIGKTPHVFYIEKPFSIIDMENIVKTALAGCAISEQ